MLEYAREALESIQGKTREDLDSDRLSAHGLVRLMAVIGEEANRISPEYRAAHATIPWSQIISLRNRLIHGYDAVDLDILWEILNQDLPPLVAELESIILRESGT
jgi:uncharacterized protein with HEPN domain